MHELSIAMSILEFAEEEAARRDVTLCAVHVRIGALSGVVRQALESAYDLARENTPLSECRLVIEEVPIMIRCRDCGTEHAIPSLIRPCCPDCGEPSTDFVQGRELQVVALELAA